MWLWICSFAVVLIICGVAYARNANHNYTAGSGMFKNSEDNLNEEDKEFSDVNYYNKDDKLS